MKCIIPSCHRTDIVARYLCEYHYHRNKVAKLLNQFPLMQNKRTRGNITNYGYMRISVSGRRVLEHRYKMEEFIKRKLNRFEIVHHKDGNRLNNSIENLQLISDQSTHISCSHSIRPRVYDWRVFKPYKTGSCVVCNVVTHSKFGLCRNHYSTYYNWKKRH